MENLREGMTMGMGGEAEAGEDAPRSGATLEGRFGRIEAAETARKALLSRRRISLRVQIYACFLLVFFFAMGIATALVVAMYQMEEKLRFLEIVNDYAIEIQQARRFEKNYFLYGTNLSDALENVYHAHDILTLNTEELGRILGAAGHERIGRDIERYEDLLESLTDLEQHQLIDQDVFERKKEIERELRKHGQRMVSSADELIRREKAALEQAIQRSRNIHIYSLIFLLIFIVLNAYLLGSRILGNINRFSDYARRIASGNFTPIMPVRRFRDEFTDLAIAINQMIQELESREAVLIQSHKMRAVGTLTAGVAHELNNPLNNITLTAHMLLEDYDGLSDEERKDMLQDVVKEADRSKGIIANLLDFARESGSQLEPLDLRQLLVDTVHLAANRVKLSGIKISLETPENLPLVHGDSQQLRQVFLNLILNAIDASPKGGKVDVSVGVADDPNYLAVKVKDNGTGIPEHIIGLIFDPFFTTKAKGKGTGLGLSVSQGIIAKHGGRIRVKSAEGKGTTFTVTVPITTLPAQIGIAKKS